MRHRQPTTVKPWSIKFWLISLTAVLLLSCGISLTILIYDYFETAQKPCALLDTYFKDSRCIRVFEYSYYHSFLYDISFSPDGSLLAVATPESIKLWEVRSGVLLQEFIFGGYEGVGMAFSPNGKQIAFGDGTGTLSLADLESGEILFKTEAHKSPIKEVVFHPNGRILASAALEDYKLKVWQLPEGQPLHVLTGYIGTISHLAFKRDGTLVSVSHYKGDISVQLWQVESGELLQEMTPSGDVLQVLEILPGAEMIALKICTERSAIACKRSAVEVRQLSDNQVLNTFELPTIDNRAIAFSVGEKFIALGEEREKVYIRRINDQVLLTTLEGNYGYIQEIVFHPTNDILAVGAESIILWKVEEK